VIELADNISCNPTGGYDRTPSAASQAGVGEARRITLRLLDELFRGAGDRQAGFRLWDGTQWLDDELRPVTVVLQHPGALRAMLLLGHELGLVEAYLYNDFDVEGDIESVFDLAEAVARGTSGWRKKIRSARDLMRLPAVRREHAGRRGPAGLSGKRHSVERVRQAVTFLYAVSNDFYALRLDRRMVYSCAYFRGADEDLDTAQVRKLDIGCGWGGLVLHASEDSGFEVRDVESLREHYALTLRHWVRRLEANHARALELVDEPTYRVWRLFMSGSAHGFAHGRLNVYQTLLVKPGEGGSSGLPLTRADWYA
jgi:hypothetical protein